MTEPTTDAAPGSPPATVIAHRLYAALWRFQARDAAGAIGHLADRTGAQS